MYCGLRFKTEDESKKDIENTKAINLGGFATRFSGPH
jgi:hypothetical protein